MRISDWSSDVCSSDLHRAGRIHKNVSILDSAARPGEREEPGNQPPSPDEHIKSDRGDRVGAAAKRRGRRDQKSGVTGTSGAGGVDPGGSHHIQISTINKDVKS